MNDLNKKKVQNKYPISDESLDSVDLIVVNKSGVVDLKIIVSGYLDDSSITVNRLLDKINNYLLYISTDDFTKEFGELEEGKINIIVSCNECPSQGIIELIKEIAPQVKSYGAKIQIEY